MPPTSFPLAPVARTAVLKVVMTDDEKARVQARAAALGRSASEHVRVTMLSDQPSQEGNPFRAMTPVDVVRTSQS